MIKKRILVTTSCFLSSLALVGCGGKKNINMQTSSNLLNERWDTLAKQICLPLSDEIPNSSDPKFMEEFTKILSTNPKCFNPNSDPNSVEQTKYLVNTKSVNEYVAKMAQKITAIEIISFEKLSDASKNRKIDFQEYDLASMKDPRKYALPYVERKDENDTITQDDKLIPIELSHIKTASGLNQDSEFSFFSTKKGKLDGANNIRGKAYVLKYRLSDNNIYSAIITIPEGSAKVPLMLYVHGGDTGLSFRELAIPLQTALKDNIVAAPALPGEDICSVDKTTGNLEKGFKRVCIDGSGNEIAPAVEAIGEKSPLDNDVVATLGLHSALKRISLGELKLNNENIKEFFVHGQPRLEFYVDKVPSFLNSYKPLLQKIAGPKTVATASSRGGATLLAAMGRSGIMLQQALSQLDNKDVDLKNIIIPPLFSSAATYYAPTTLLMGKFRILFKDMLNGKVSDISHLNALPMIPDLQKNQYFSNFRNSDLANNQKELNELIGFLGASDVTYLAPYISVATQNWTNTLDNILDLKKLIAANPAEFEKVLRNALGALGKQNIRTQENPLFVNDFLGKFLTAFIDHKDGEKSLLKHFSDALLIKNVNSSDEPCSIVYNPYAKLEITYKGNCSVRGIFTNGAGTFDLMGEKKVLNLKPILEKDDDVNIKKLSTLFEKLSNDKYGLKNFTDALASRKNDESIVKSLGFLSASLKEADFELSLENIKILIPYLIASSITVQLDLEPFKDNFDIKNQNLNDIFVESIALETNLSLLKDNIQIKSLLKEPLNYIKKYRKASPGSLLLMHNTQDQIVDHTQSLIAKTVFDTVFSMSFGTGVYFFPLNEMNIPPVGTQFIAFQPEKRFYSIPVGGKYNPKRGELCSDKKNKHDEYPADYNVKEKKCFAKNGNIAHGDPSFLTGKIINSHLQNLEPGATEKNSSLAKAFLYGYDPGLNVPSTSISTQIFVMNETFNKIPKELRPKGHTYPLQSQCVTSDANCFIFGASVPISSTAHSVASENTPLFTRTLYQDALKMSSLKGGVWDKNAEEHDSMTPTDVMSMWFATSAKASLTAQ
ncbi:hypothetical protein [Fluviispira vulneris]|uniref:hypothetical protein n=1 Tax=Fluviispira vulneris TaxID=2763012 RepID=UPI001645A999|nr:hypothetical protein [Fluviispira vulneris]